MEKPLGLMLAAHSAASTSTCARRENDADSISSSSAALLRFEKTSIFKTQIGNTLMFAFGPLKDLSNINMWILFEESLERKHKRIQRQHAKVAPVRFLKSAPVLLTLPLPADGRRVGFLRKK
jgi:hypothetical protein